MPHGKKAASKTPMDAYVDGCRATSISTGHPTRKSRRSSSRPTSRPANASGSRRHSKPCLPSLERTFKSASLNRVALRSEIQAWPRTSPISRHGPFAWTGAPLPWPAAEATLLKFVAHHLWNPAKREAQRKHGMPQNVAESLREDRLLRSEGPHAPATVRRRLSSRPPWRGIEGPFASPALRPALRLAVQASVRPRHRKRRRAV